MAYISKEKAKEIRDLIKAKYPASKGFKFSITVQHYSSLSVCIMESPFEFEKVERKSGSDLGSAGGIYNTYKDSIFTKEEETFVSNVIKLSNQSNYDNSDCMTDYFDVGYYFDIKLGKWDKEYKQNVK